VEQHVDVVEVLNIGDKNGDAPAACSPRCDWKEASVAVAEIFTAMRWKSLVLVGINLITTDTGHKPNPGKTTQTQFGWSEST